MKILILLHEKARFQIFNNYEIKIFAKCWRDHGHTVYFLYGIKKFVPADICFVYVDLSVVPQEYLDFAHRYPIAVNGEVSDIRKRTFSTQLLNKADNYDGKVIVKTNLNYGGLPEEKISKNAFSLYASKLKNKIPALDSGSTSSQNYLIFDHRMDVPETYFNDSNYIIQKFLPEIEGEYYCLRVYLFLGEVSHCWRDQSLDPIVKARSVISTEQIEPHNEILEMRKILKFDYGKFDYCLNDGKAILLDVNKTVGMSRFKLTKESKKRYCNRASGLYGFLKKLPAS